jgi:hypothetical protein
MKSWILVGLSSLVILTCMSCGSTSRVTVEKQRAGLLMLEGENIHRNKGFYKNKKSVKRHKKNVRNMRRNYRR